MDTQLAVDAIRTLNDEFRQTLRGGTVVFTAAVLALGDRAQAEILKTVAEFDRFDPDNDPHGEHDFGTFEFEGQRLFFKIDYYDLALYWHSPNPADPSVTTRVLTVMLAEEY
jgi:hypothetical protein